MKKNINRFIFVMLILCIFVVMISKSLNNIIVAQNKQEIRYYVGREIEINENSKYVPYIVVCDDYNGNTLLLRKNLLDEDFRMSDYYAIYAGNEIDQFLNGLFYNAFDQNMQNIICNSAIDVVADDYQHNGVSIKTIYRKIFLLSYTEFGFNLNYHAGTEGKKIINDPALRIAVKPSNKASSYQLRSVDTNYENCFYAIGRNGEVGSTDASGKNGVRPAFCVPSNTIIFVNDTGELFIQQK